MMNLGRGIPLSLLACLAVLLGPATSSSGQNLTSGSISGVAVDPQGAVLPGASVEATHQPTGTQYSTVTDGDGRFLILSVRVGGPYDLPPIIRHA